MSLGFRNTKTIYYALFEEEIPVVDSDGFETGDYTLQYDSIVPLNANVVPKSSTIAREYFGEQLEYHKVILVNIDCPISEDSVIWIGLDPLTDTGVRHNFEVAGISDSLNYKAIAVKKVTNYEVQRNTDSGLSTGETEEGQNQP